MDCSVELWWQKPSVYMMFCMIEANYCLRVHLKSICKFRFLFKYIDYWYYALYRRKIFRINTEFWFSKWMNAFVTFIVMLHYDMCSKINDMVMIHYQFAMNAARMNSCGWKQITKNALNYPLFNIVRNIKWNCFKQCFH